MVIPWVGFPLADLIKKCEPTSKAKYLEFTTAYDTKQMPGLRSPVLRWPYVEGLRMDEAMHPLTILVVGLYGEVLPNQDGAPLRLAVPWKYGFKHVKSIAKIRFTEKQPLNTWQESAPQEYGFFANVNPSVDHPRWSQSTERRIGEFLRRKTLMFWHGDQVASLPGMDLKRNYRPRARAEGSGLLLKIRIARLVRARQSPRGVAWAVFSYGLGGYTETSTLSPISMNETSDAPLHRHAAIRRCASSPAGTRSSVPADGRAVRVLPGTLHLTTYAIVDRAARSGGRLGRC
jgi:hypothetical protein